MAERLRADVDIPWRAAATPQPEQDYLMTASRLPLRSYRSIPRFLGLTSTGTGQGPS